MMPVEERLQGTAISLLVLASVAFAVGLISGVSQVVDDSTTISYPSSDVTEFLAAGAGMYTTAAILFGARAILLGLIGLRDRASGDD